MVLPVEVDLRPREEQRETGQGQGERDPPRPRRFRTVIDRLGIARHRPILPAFGGDAGVEVEEPDIPQNVSHAPATSPAPGSPSAAIRSKTRVDIPKSTAPSPSPVSGL